MSFTKTYFLCPTSDFINPPPTGPLCLGSIIRSPSTPQYPLNRANVIAVPDTAIFSIVETNWKKKVSTGEGLGLGVYAQFLQLATGTEVEVAHSNQISNTFAFDTLTTLAFEPTQEYVQEAIKAAPAVQSWLKEPKQRFAPSSSLYLVTGMKLVKGAMIKYSTSKNMTATGNLGINIPTLGMTVGPKGQWSSAVSDETEFNRESEFVFAFRLKRLKFGRNVKMDEYNKGAFLAVSDREEEGNDASLSVLVEEVDGSDINTARAVSDVTEHGMVYCVPT
ncbi:hypothetical protein EIK77_007042 [Talaromyces pinophilus]|nr:hypothetical protein EIK77_007042 [Talaromyces pinophilus]PCG98248.1 Hypothetical protein PENO1_058870 [Penicillium occitanis (nom. inval.)]PCG98272.1 hypothetical protein PENOC_063840 [Penicillium occitanis (nom. inval.)]